MRTDEVLLQTLIQSLDGCAREIDKTFARAGEQLGQGLTLFEGLKERLSTLSSELGGGEITQAGDTLTGLAGDLRAIGGALSREIDTLAALALHSHSASQLLEGLLSHMRLITILARSARIEAVSVGASSRDIGDFTTEIVVLTSKAQDTIQGCARDHDRLVALIKSALAAQQAFDQRYGAALTALASNLDRTLEAVTERQRRGVVLTRDAAVHSGKIAMTAGGAIIALQSGDSIRQRLEHALGGLRLLASLEAGKGEGASFGVPEREAVALVLRRLEAAQLDASATALAENAEAIEDALALLAGDTAGLLDMVRSLYSADGSVSFLAALEADLALASELLSECDRARAGVDQVTQTLTGVLETCQETVAALAGTVSSIVLIGMNAGLRAARVGTGGRSLVIIAQELKVAAHLVESDAAGLTPIFAKMDDAAAGLAIASGLDAARFAALDNSMRDALAAMRRTGDRLSATLGQLSREGGGFGDVLAHARLSFSNAGAMSDVITGAAVELERMAVGRKPTPETVALVGEVLHQHVWPRYTMAAERDIHQAILAEQGVSSEAIARKVVQPDCAMGDCLF